jgi:hypothetical protein
MAIQNLNQAYKRVKASKGADGVDAMSIAELFPWIRANRAGRSPEGVGPTVEGTPQGSRRGSPPAFGAR